MNKKIGNLVISRFVGESIIFEDGTEIYLAYASRGRAKIAIKSNQAILRKELVKDGDSLMMARIVLDEKKAASNVNTRPEPLPPISGPKIVQNQGMLSRVKKLWRKRK